MKGAIDTCENAGISLGGGHSIDSPEPIFGLAVTGKVKIANIKTNAGARVDDILILTKPLGVGILTTAEKKGLLCEEHRGIAAQQMKQLNNIGQRLGAVIGVHAVTDVTGFGLSGHLIEMMEASGTEAQIDFGQLPLIVDTLENYITQGAVPGGTLRNWESYGAKVYIENGTQEKVIRSIIADPQTSGGLVIAVDPLSLPTVSTIFDTASCGFYIIGEVTTMGNDSFKIICH
jgi:selenide,water dikinase